MSHLIQVKRFSDEGTSSPFMARIWVGLLKFRDDLFLLGLEGEDRRLVQGRFDHRFGPMFQAAQATRDAAQEIKRVVTAHLDALRAGRLVLFRDSQCDILETIDTPLRQAVDKLIDQASVATKAGLQCLLRDPLDLEIGFLFQNEADFKKGIASLRAAAQSDLAQYLEDVRGAWLHDLNKLRNDRHHEGWSLSSVSYELVGPCRLTPRMPGVLGLQVDEFAGRTANRVLLFIEAMMVYAMQRRCQHPIFVAEIPKDQRDPTYPMRFRLSATGLDPSPPWVIEYRDDCDFV